ncbi:type II toxin-antitoxin system VapC family toxin [Sphingomonas sp. LT1P40]|uniref:type II toxin-antitoxin system VapC family toxin n=1 Tax=Alteristakelama amylovorans TaxID=3096166 RepID=UPI002FC8333B
MSWFMDASAIIAIVGQEADWQTYADRADEETELLWSAVSQWESVFGLRRLRDLTIAEAHHEVEHFAREHSLVMVDLGEKEAQLAIDAASRYGRGSGHPAKLNMGDCFAYACAKTNDARLLYKGNDFIHTDLA